MMENSTLQGSAATPEIKLTYDGGKVAISFFISVIGAWTAVNMMANYRHETDKRVRAGLLIAFGVIVGGVSIWTMHFMGMAALHLSVQDAGGQKITYVELYDLPKTIASLLSAILFVSLGGAIASTDPFYGESKENNVTAMQTLVDFNKMMKAKNAIKFAALFKRPQRFILGGIVSGAGVGIMHFLGMAAVLPIGFHIQWVPGFIVMACIVACTVSSVGFWIIFRVLQWKASSYLLRMASSLIIAVAVCVTHYTGMFAAIYTWDGPTVIQQFDDETGGTPPEDLVTFGVLFSASTVTLALSWSILSVEHEMHQTRSEVMTELVELIREQTAEAKTLAELQQNLINRFIKPVNSTLASRIKKKRRMIKQRSSRTVVPSSATSGVEE